MLCLAASGEFGELGLDIDPSDIERAISRSSPIHERFSAKFEDARLQRENNIMNKILSGGAKSDRLSHTSSMWGDNSPSGFHLVQQSSPLLRKGGSASTSERRASAEFVR